MQMPLEPKAAGILLRIDEAEHAVQIGISAVTPHAYQFALAFFQAIAAGEASEYR
jgi:hypothetical protein